MRQRQKFLCPKVLIKKFSEDSGRLSISSTDRKINKRFRMIINRGESLRLLLRKIMSKTSEQRHKAKTEYFAALRETAEAVDPYVRGYLEQHFRESDELKLLLMSRYRFGRPQLRPAQVRFSYEIVGGDNWHSIIPVCAAVEARDTGYYCLDELIDLGADPKLVLLGGSFLSVSYGMLRDVSSLIPLERFFQVLEELVKLDESNVQAALIDLHLLPNEKNREDYMRKARGYSFSGSALRIGAILGGGTGQQVLQLGEAGESMGTSHIIANDVWDFGKDLDDFRNGRYTLPINFALERAIDNDRVILTRLFGKRDLSEEEKNVIRRIMVKNGAVKYGKEKVDEFCQQAVSILGKFPDSWARRMLEFSTTMAQRNRYYDELEKYE